MQRENVLSLKYKDIFGQFKNCWFDKKVRTMGFEPTTCETPFDSLKKCKVYHDGSHYVATMIPNKRTRKSKPFVKSSIREEFDRLYTLSLTQFTKKAERRSFIKEHLLAFSSNICDIDTYLDKQIIRREKNFYAVKKRVRRKANLYKWNYFVTFTYDSKKHTEDSFMKKLKKCLSNLSTRQKWRYMGVFETSPNGRKHFHGLFYIPNGPMLSKNENVSIYDTINNRRKNIVQNSFFAERFGQNDFSKINEEDLKNGKAVNYILKYIEKSGDKLVQSRGVPSFIEKTIDITKDIVCEFVDFVKKFVLPDYLINEEKEILKVEYKQVHLTDCCLC